MFSSDMFELFEKKGIMNPEVGQAYRTKVLQPGGMLGRRREKSGWRKRDGQGEGRREWCGVDFITPGSRDGDDILRDFLGREPVMEPFMHSIGLQ